MLGEVMGYYSKERYGVGKVEAKWNGEEYYPGWNRNIVKQKPKDEEKKEKEEFLKEEEFKV
jgi:hypothetical protein